MNQKADEGAFVYPDQFPQGTTYGRDKRTINEEKTYEWQRNGLSDSRKVLWNGLKAPGYFCRIRKDFTGLVITFGITQSIYRS